MKCLIDTNVMIWFTEDSPLLPEYIRELIIDDDNEIYVSIASLWEIAIKHSLGKLDLKINLDDFFTILRDSFCFNFLSINTEHILLQSNLPFHHRDPFDRMIYAQGVVENMEFLYTDKVFDLYRSA